MCSAWESTFIYVNALHYASYKLSLPRKCEALTENTRVCDDHATEEEEEKMKRLLYIFCEYFEYVILTLKYLAYLA